MDEAEPRPLNAEPAIEDVRELLAEAELVSRDLSRIADEIVARAESGRQDAQRLVAQLREATSALVPDDPEEGAGSEEALEDPHPESTAVGSDGARLLARQMLANGARREDVERDLRTSFGVKDAAAVVDSIVNAGAQSTDRAAP